MECLYCGTTLAPLRGATDGGYCSDDHRLEHMVANAPSQYLFLLEPPSPALPGPVGAPAVAALPVFPGFLVQKPALEAQTQELPLQFPDADLLPWSPFPVPREPKRRPDGIFPRVAASKPAVPSPRLVPYTPSLQPDPPPPLLTRLGGFALHHWKLSLAIVPLALIAFLDTSSYSLPASKLMPKQSAARFLSFPMLADLKNSAHRRAAVQLTDDFRGGLDEWESNQKLAASWTYDDEGFVRPGALAVFRPTRDLQDYSLEFLGQIEQKGMGVAFRVIDWNHYYAIKLNLAKAGPSTAMELVRYAVEGKREVARFSKRFTPAFRDNSLCRFQLNVHGNEFTLINQGQIVDDWTDDRYPRGGVGFFTGKGERARLRWVEVSHHTDPLGRLLALLAPNTGQDGN
jgi:hypothetical protein